MTVEPFWRTKPLADLSEREWESLCDGCGKCCLVRFEDEQTGEVIATRAACRLFDDATCRCTRYSARERWVPDCVKLTAANIPRLSWMPATCAYRLVYEGKDLPEWHPLVSRSLDSVHAAGASVRGRTFNENLLARPEDALRYTDWSCELHPPADSKAAKSSRRHRVASAGRSPT